MKFHFWRIPPPQLKVYPAIVVEAVGAAPVSRSSPVSRPDKSLRTRPASRTAPSRFNRPAPCSKLLTPASGCAVYSRSALTRFGLRFGFRWINRAAAPATVGLDIDVPLILIIL